MPAGVEIGITPGQVTEQDGISFGATYCFPADHEKPDRIHITLWTKSTGEADVELSPGETLHFANQTWKLTEIDSPGMRDWSATLVRTA